MSVVRATVSFNISVPSIDPAGKTTSVVPVPSVVTVSAVIDAPPRVIEVAVVAPKVKAPAVERSKALASDEPVVVKLSAPMLIAPKLAVIEPASRAPTVVTLESVSRAVSIVVYVVA